MENQSPNIQINPYISIIMPAFNCEKYIIEAVNSVLSQTYLNFELIIIDDASKDQTLKIINELSIQDSRIKIYSNEKNQGVSVTRNIGVSYASGDWIAFLDSDDQWEKTKLEKQMECAESTNGSLIYTGSSFINEDGVAYLGVMKVPEKVNYKQLLKQNIISCSSSLVKKSYLIKYRMENDKMHEDYAVWLKILKEEAFAYGVDEPLLVYRISNRSKSGDKIKSAIMVYRVYRYIGLNYIVAIYYWLWYVAKWLKKRMIIYGYVRYIRSSLS